MFPISFKTVSIVPKSGDAAQCRKHSSAPASFALNSETCECSSSIAKCPGLLGAGGPAGAAAAGIGAAAGTAGAETGAAAGKLIVSDAQSRRAAILR